MNDIADLIAPLVTFRRDIHAHPELGFAETRTAARIAQALRDAGIEVHEGIGGTGVVGVLRASGALDLGLDGIRSLIEWAGWDTRFVDALPTALVKPFSGSAARAMLIETMQSHGVDSFPALVAATMQGSTETTFYVLAVYFGAVGIQRARHAVGCALLADLAGVLASIGVCYWFFG